LSAPITEVSRLPKPTRAKGAALPVVPPRADDPPKSSPRAAVPAPAARGRASLRPAEEAWAELARPLRERLGIRALFLGVTGKGKTTGLKDFLAYVERRHLAELVLIHDVKKPEPQYEGEILHEAREIYSAPPAAYPARRVLRRRNLDHMPSVEGLCRVAMEAGYNDIATIAVIDEFQRGLTDGGKFSSPSLRRLFCEGLGLHASVIATKQLPQLISTEATGQSTKIYFGLSVEGINYLVDDRKITKEHAAVLERLEVGQFTMVPEEGDFNGHAYVVPAP
jgi:hypothetical protein